MLPQAGLIFVPVFMLQLIIQYVGTLKEETSRKQEVPYNNAFAYIEYQHNKFDDLKVNFRDD